MRRCRWLWIALGLMLCLCACEKRTPDAAGKPDAVPGSDTYADAARPEFNAVSAEDLLQQFGGEQDKELFLPVGMTELAWRTDFARENLEPGNYSWRKNSMAGQEAAADAESGEFHMYLLWGSDAKEALPRYLKQATEAGMVVLLNSQPVSGQEKLDEFLEKTKRGETGNISLISYQTLQGANYGTELFREELLQYPKCYSEQLEYDGEQYHFKVWELKETEAELISEVSFRYLMHYEEDRPETNVRYHKTEVYALVNDDTLTWHQIEWGMLSSQFGDYIPNYLITFKNYNEASFYPGGAYQPDMQEEALWEHANGFEGTRMHCALVSLDEKENREYFSPQNPEAQTLLSYWKDGWICWTKELPYRVQTSLPFKDGVALYGIEERGCKMTAAYLECYDSTGNRLAWKEISPNESVARRLLAVGANEEGFLCVLERREGDGTHCAELWQMDAQGNILWTLERELKGSTVAACVQGDHAYLAQQRSDSPYAIEFFRVDREGTWSSLEGIAAPADQALALRDIFEKDGYLYISGHLCKASETQNEADRYTAVLYQIPLQERKAEGRTFRLLQSWPGAFGGTVCAEYDGVWQGIVWQIEEILESSTDSQIRCRVIQYGYDSAEDEWAEMSGEEPGYFRLLDKTVTYTVTYMLNAEK